MPGVNDNRRVPCSVSVHHGHFPSNERCPMCAPPVIKAWVPPTYSEHLSHYVQRLRGYADKEAATQKLLYLSFTRVLSSADCKLLSDWIEENYPS